MTTHNKRTPMTPEDAREAARIRFEMNEAYERNDADGYAMAQMEMERLESKYDPE